MAQQPEAKLEDKTSDIECVKSFSALEREIVNVMAHTCAVAALHAAHARGRNNRTFAGELAMNAMRTSLHKNLPVSAEIVLGEGERNDGPVLFTGERLGPDGDPQLKMTLV